MSVIDVDEVVAGGGDGDEEVENGLEVSSRTLPMRSHESELNQLRSNVLELGGVGGVTKSESESLVRKYRGSKEGKFMRF